MNYLSAFFVLATIFFHLFEIEPVNQDFQEITPGITDINISHIFGEQINIQARVEPGLDIKDIWIIIEREDNTSLARESLKPSPYGEVYFIYKVSQSDIHVFSELSIWFEIEMLNGTIFKGEPTKYVYDDNRFQWQTIKSDDFSVSWYQEDPKLGKKILNTSYEGLLRINRLVRMPSPEGIKIYAYVSAVDLQETLKFSGESTTWVAGHAEPASGTIVVSLPPGPEQSFEIQRQIPHELVHILLYRKLGDPYTNLPRWLNEGLASSAELFPNPDYQLLLNTAYERDALIPIESLCDSFPIDAANFQLAYAEAFNFTWYIHDTYGIESMENLIQAYAQGQRCDQAVQAIFEIPLSELERNWRQVTFSEPAGLIFEDGTISLMVLIGFAFIVPISLMIKGVGNQK